MNAAQYYEQLVQMFPENYDYKIYQAQCLYQACLYEEAYKITESIKNPEYQSQVQIIQFYLFIDFNRNLQVVKLQAAIRYGEENLVASKKLIEMCSSDDPDTEVNLACLLYKVL